MIPKLDPTDAKLFYALWIPLLERHLKRGSVFISLEDEQVYMVGGILSSWEEMIPQADLPILLRATLIPFLIDPNILTGLMYVGSVFLWGTRGYLEVTSTRLE